MMSIDKMTKKWFTVNMRQGRKGPLTPFGQIGFFFRAYF
jgi:hypothetical protein